MVAKNYTINFVDPNKSTLNILPNTIVGPSAGIRQTDIDLLGMGHSLWGKTILENLVHMLENFSSEEDIHVITSVPTTSTFVVAGNVERAFPENRIFNIWDSTGSPGNNGSYTVQSSLYDGSTKTTITITASTLNTTPASFGNAGELGIPNKAGQFSAITPIEGQLWYNQTRGQLYVYGLAGSPVVGSWKRVGGITFSSTAPISASVGDLWWETTNYVLASDEYGRNLHINVGGSPEWVRITENYLPRDGSKAMTNTLDLGNNFITNVLDPTSDAHVGDRAYNDGRYILSDGTVPATGILNMSGYRIEGLGNPNSNDDAVNLGYLAANYLAISGNILDLGNNFITNVLDPTSDAHVGDRLYNDNRYVNLDGDTMSAPLWVSSTGASEETKIHLHSTDSNGSYIRFSNSTTGLTNTHGSLIGVTDTEKLAISNLESTDTYFTTASITRMTINGTSGVVNFTETPTVNGQTIWHAGNDGPGTGLNADLLDGLDASNFLQSSYSHPNQNYSGNNQSFANYASAPWFSAGSAGYYIISASGITRNNGDGAALLFGPRIYWGSTPSTNPSLLYTISPYVNINWPDGNAPTSVTTTYYLGTVGVYRILFDAIYWAMQYNIVRLAHN